MATTQESARVCRTPAEVFDLGYRLGQDDPPLSQATADLVAAILAPHRPALEQATHARRPPEDEAA